MTIRSIAAAIRPVFVRNNWTWWYPEGDRIPTVDEIVEMIDRLLIELDTDDLSTASTGRITVMRDDSAPAGYRIMLEFPINDRVAHDDL